MDTFQLVKALIYPTTHIDVLLGKQLKLLQKIFYKLWNIISISLSPLVFCICFACAAVWGISLHIFFVQQECGVSCYVCHSLTHRPVCPVCIVVHLVWSLSPSPFLNSSNKYWHMKIAFKIPSSLRVQLANFNCSWKMKE